MVKWEYNYLQIWGDAWDLELFRKFQAASEALGAEGWELVQILHLQKGYQAFFKRPKF